MHTVSEFKQVFRDTCIPHYIGLHSQRIFNNSDSLGYISYLQTFYTKLAAMFSDVCINNQLTRVLFHITVNTHRH